MQATALWSRWWLRQRQLLQVLLGGLTHWTVGLIATFMTVACTIAADTGAYAFGKTLGRTQLISISPKKTVEGAVGGLACSTVVALAFWRFLRWPAQVKIPASEPFLQWPCMQLMQTSVMGSQ